MLTKKYFKTKDEAEVTFEYAGKKVNSVALMAEFNQWQPISMKFNKKHNSFKTKVRLAKGSSFQFRYLLDGHEWENEQKADGYVPNRFGTENSVIIL